MPMALMQVYVTLLFSPPYIYMCICYIYIMRVPVFICDKTRLPFSINFFLDFMTHIRSIFKIFTSMNLRNYSFVKPYNKLAVRVLSGRKHSVIASCL